jgi:hypothetical protein
MNNLIDFEHVNERICKIWVKLKYYNLTLISPHVPTEENGEVAKEGFYNFIFLRRRYEMQFLITT